MWHNPEGFIGKVAMFCSVCGCQLPAVAKFCAKCGSAVERQQAIKVDEASASSGEILFCVHCGRPHVPSQNYCNNCGKRLLNSPVAHSIPNSAFAMAAAQATAAQLQVQELANPPEYEPTPSTPPYARFAIFALAAGVMASIVAFDAGDDVARGKWTSTLSAAVAAILTAVLLKQASMTWTKMKAAQGNAAVLRRKLVSRTIFFGVVFIVIGAFVGHAIGTSGAQTNQFIEDVERASQLNKRINQARTSAERTIPAQIGMYRSIAADVVEWEALLRQLRAELATYDEKYPAQHESTAKLIKSVELGLNRANLLQQQIKVAKEMESLPVSAQWDAWQNQMQPLVNQEDALLD